jgi:hypothetical protein
VQGLLLSDGDHNHRFRPRAAIRVRCPSFQKAVTLLLGHMGNTLAPKGVFGAGYPPGLVIEEAWIVLHKTDQGRFQAIERALTFPD